jgi:hypothetical protein
VRRLYKSFGVKGLRYLCLARRGFHLYSEKVHRAAILYVTMAVGCTGTESHLNEASLVYIQLKYSTRMARFGAFNKVVIMPIVESKSLLFAYSVLLLGDTS